MKIIVGLGNPGDKYSQTRHNVGFMVIDKLSKGDKGYKSKSGLLEYVWTEIKSEKVELIKPLTFMNESGKALSHIKSKHPDLLMSDFIVIHDDLDIKLGEYKIQNGKGPRDHKGIISIEQDLGDTNFWRLRIGVENRDNESGKIPGEKYVLEKFTNSELEVLEEILPKVIEELKSRMIK